MIPGIVAAQMRVVGGGAVPAPIPAAMWRINITGSYSTDTYKALLGEVEFRATVGGEDQANGGTASASSQSTAPAGAFDNSTSGFWTSASTAELPQWVSYTFTSPVTVAEVLLTSGATSVRAARAPSAFTVDYSTDAGASWVAVGAFTSSPAWGLSESRLFAL